jgi:uncharacterized protein (DUF1684 family)
MSFSSLARWCLCAAVVCACTHQRWPDPPPVDRAAFLSEHAAWRLQYQQTVRDNWVELAGLWPLSEGRTAFGTDSSLPIVLAGSGPRRIVGTFLRHGRAVYVEPAGPALRLADDNRAIVAPVALRTDDDSVPSRLQFGSYRLWIHVVEGRYYVRARDTASAHLTAFRLAPEYEPDARWRVAARFDPYRRSRTIRVMDIVGVDEAFSVLGELLFRVDRKQLRLQAFAEPGDSTLLWLMFGDSTNLRETYGGGRYLWVPAPDSTGWTVIDFTRSISPPCAYTAYATCALAPPENRLAVGIAAGEKRGH